MNLSFKKCSLKNLKKLVEISKTTFINAFEKANNPKDFSNYINVAFSESKIRSELLNENSDFYFTYLNNKLVGYFKLNKNEAQTETFNTKTIELERIYVIEQFQHQGIGKYMLFEIFKIVKSNNVSFLWLGVWEKNRAAIKFYQRYDFKKFDTHFYYIGNDKQTDWLMKLDFI
ncbi:MAG: GNAT family N-acetyltransferase [Lutibacter sp.]|uniref:GNAT family N-acetyltransferase n=1 Tax=Lutibacter sp. TaxID=1925666 RepID=UPI001804944F|nr:GNAT family N-acetyltransferase [Lutibacter sp.]MBT8317305.1 GNAT family N-acetyltransferase [Lutibacter sp.]NNJ58164.1 GNAT family N-acetyltransferase [Lutibacter sp.]